MPLPGAYVNRSNTAGEYCSNCKHYSNNHCVAFKEQVAAYGWCKVWEKVGNEIRSS
jgi:hypothetical protein